MPKRTPLVNTYLLIDKLRMSSDGYQGKAAEILDVAESRMRAGGFDAVSYRDIAADVGIKSASVHYHFPQKVDLGAAVIGRYRERFAAVLGAADDPADTLRDRIGRLCGGYRTGVIDEGKVCLACVLGSEALNLPPPLSGAVEDYFNWLTGWTETALFSRSADSDGRSRIDIEPSVVLGSLQGSMILAIAMKRPELFLATERWLLDAVG